MALRRWVQVGRQLCLRGHNWVRLIPSYCLPLPKVPSSQGQLKLGGRHVLFSVARGEEEAHTKDEQVIQKLCAFWVYSSYLGKNLHGHTSM